MKHRLQVDLVQTMLWSSMSWDLVDVRYKYGHCACIIGTSCGAKHSLSLHKIADLLSNGESVSVFRPFSLEECVIKEKVSRMLII